MRIRVAVRDQVGATFETKEIKRIESVSDRDLKRIAERAETVIRYMIENKTTGGTGNLANSRAWDVDKIPNGYGVGDIPMLDSDLPYWNHIDKGSEGIGANWQHYLPKGYWENGRFIEDPTGYSSLMPETPIPALNYIASTLQQMEIEIPSILKG